LAGAIIAQPAKATQTTSFCEPATGLRRKGALADKDTTRADINALSHFKPIFSPADLVLMFNSE
jgi:hypothetical protein